MTREELEARANELGVKFTARLGDEKLAERIAEAESAGDEAPEAPLEVECKVLLRNLWTSKGKAYLSDTVSLPVDEAEALQADDKVVIK
jgi:hypothetical protein